MKNNIIMPKATALWLKLNTNLTMEQISQFCGIDLLMLDALHQGCMKSHNPLISQQITKEEILKGESDPIYVLKSCLNLSDIISNKTHRKHIPLAYRRYKKEIINWFLKKLPENLHIEDKVIKKIAKVLSTNSKFVIKTIEEIKKNPDSVKETMDPMSISVCSSDEIKFVLENN